ncbi:GNAT family N-acetyltransferase [Rhodohalobacter sulfatireducens]|uniref:N-acetyltransferase n=1 Tax=Rhodohalobacter sulfatireducens TaxID=2911366 RepID=A0ABS9K9Z4_9BACT|nr:GNAT family N-acetyltransferase [Rhodohalobacter sulfatireducens]MCG2587672.1 N-acetyltransferase [Rhodohalobacter sulfatireducens]
MEKEPKGTFSDNKEKKRFELQVGEITAFVDYIINKKGNIYLTHTEVPKEAEGQGYAKELLENVFREIEKRELELVPICPFVKAYLHRKPEWKKLLADFAQF